MLQEISPHTGLMGWGFSCHPQVLKTIGSRITILRNLLESNIKLNLQLCFSSESVPSVLSQVVLEVTCHQVSPEFNFQGLLIACRMHVKSSWWSPDVMYPRWPHRQGVLVSFPTPEKGIWFLLSERFQAPFSALPSVTLFGSFLYAKWCFLPSADCPGHFFSNTPTYFLHSVRHPLKCSPSDICCFCWNRISTNVLSSDSCIWYSTWKRSPLVTAWTE